MYLPTTYTKTYLKPLLWLWIGLLLIFMASCSKSETPEKDRQSDETAGHISGMGPSTGPLQGAPFKLSATVDIPGGIKGVSFVTPGKEYCQVVGSGYFVLFSMELVNHTGKDTILVFPAGLTFASESTEDQNGILIQELPVHLARGATCKTLFYAFCANEHRSGSGDDSKYAFGPICTAPPIQELIALLIDKKVNLAPGERPSVSGPAGIIQTWIWKITDGDGLSEDDRVHIGELPGKKNT